MKNTFTESLRYEYPLSVNSIVMDVGAYKGVFSLNIARKFGCRILAYEPVARWRDVAKHVLVAYSRAEFFDYGLGGKTRLDVFGIKGDQSGLYCGDQEKENVKIVSIIEELNRLGNPKIDLLKLNVEGMEYEIIDALMSSGKLSLIDNLQVQFHCASKEHEGLRERIKKDLLKTHRVTLDFPWCWESFRNSNIVNQAENTLPISSSASSRRPASEFISFSQAGQDRFVHTICVASAFKPVGTFLDIGCGHPIELSNTYGLEKIGWKGWLIDWDDYCVSLCREQRISPVFKVDMTKGEADAISYLVSSQVDYLSLDINENSLVGLKRILSWGKNFGIITIEHDCYRFGDGPKEAMRLLLKDAGYDLVVGNVTSKGAPFEDWWVHPKLVPQKYFQSLRRTE